MPQHTFSSAHLIFSSTCHNSIVEFPKNMCLRPLAFLFILPMTHSAHRQSESAVQCDTGLGSAITGSQTDFSTRSMTRLVFYNVWFVRFPGVRSISTEAVYCKRRCGRSLPAGLCYCNALPTLLYSMIHVTSNSFRVA
jgi:hypothetical protein